MLDIAVPSIFLDVNKIHMLSFQKKGKYPPMAELRYESSLIENKYMNCTVLTPELIIEDWNCVKGRLRLSCEGNGQFAAKISAIQDYLVHTIANHQELLFGEIFFTEEDIDQHFRRLYDGPIGNSMTCYISPHHLFPLYEKGDRVAYENFNSSLGIGRSIRLIIHMQGVSHLPGDIFRIQHQILGAYLVGA
jgi:hypothetical protein